MSILVSSVFIYSLIGGLERRMMRQQGKARWMLMFAPFFFLFTSIATMSNADPQFRQERDALVAKVENCFLQSEAPVHVCVEGIREKCVDDFKTGRAYAGWGTPRYCTNIVEQQAEAFLQHEIVLTLTWALEEKLKFPGGHGSVFNDLMRSEVNWNEYANSYCSGLSGHYSGGTARGGYIQICRTRLIIKRVVEMRTVRSKNLTVTDFLKE